MSATPRYKVSICGFGLIGGSIALDLLVSKPKPKVVAYDCPKVLQSVAKDVRFTVHTERVWDRAIDGADIIILAAPPKANHEMLVDLSRKRLLDRCLIIDAGSTKRSICAIGKKLTFGKGTQFVGCHPMAGTENSGHRHSERYLFRGNPWFVDSNVRLMKENKEKLRWLTRSLQAPMVTISAEDHDKLVAVISHLPQMLSTLLAAQLSPNILQLAGPGLKSLLRLAGSPYALWSNIIEENRDQIVDALIMYRGNLSTIISHMKKNQSLELVFNSAVRSYRCLS